MERLPARILALDVGDRRIGVAATDRLGLTVQGLQTRTRRGLEDDVAYFRGLVETEGIGKVVVGLPLHMNGSESPQSRKVQVFADRLREKVPVPVVFWDERLTSFAAEQELEEMGMSWRRRRRHVDEMAATLILEDFLVGRPREAGA